MCAERGHEKSQNSDTISKTQILRNLAKTSKTREPLRLLVFLVSEEVTTPPIECLYPFDPKTDRLCSSPCSCLANGLDPNGTIGSLLFSPCASIVYPIQEGSNAPMSDTGRNIIRSYLVRYGHGYKNAAAVIGVSEKTFTKKMNGIDGAGITMFDLERLIKAYKITRSDVELILS